MVGHRRIRGLPVRQIQAVEAAVLVALAVAAMAADLVALV